MIYDMLDPVFEMAVEDDLIRKNWKWDKKDGKFDGYLEKLQDEFRRVSMGFYSKFDRKWSKNGVKSQKSSFFLKWSAVSPVFIRVHKKFTKN